MRHLLTVCWLCVDCVLTVCWLCVDCLLLQRFAALAWPMSASGLHPRMGTYCLHSALQASFHRRLFDFLDFMAEVQMPSEAQLRSAMEIIIVAKDVFKDEKLVSEIKRGESNLIFPWPRVHEQPVSKILKYIRSATVTEHGVSVPWQAQRPIKSFSIVRKDIAPKGDQVVCHFMGQAPSPHAAHGFWK